MKPEELQTYYRSEQGTSHFEKRKEITVATKPPAADYTIEDPPKLERLVQAVTPPTVDT